MVRRFQRLLTKKKGQEMFALSHLEPVDSRGHESRRAVVFIYDKTFSIHPYKLEMISPIVNLTPGYRQRDPQSDIDCDYDEQELAWSGEILDPMNPLIENQNSRTSS